VLLGRQNEAGFLGAEAIRGGDGMERLRFGRTEGGRATTTTDLGLRNEAAR